MFVVGEDVCSAGLLETNTNSHFAGEVPPVNAPPLACLFQPLSRSFFFPLVFLFVVLVLRLSLSLSVSLTSVCLCV